MADVVEILPCPPELRADSLRLVLREFAPEQQVALVASLSSTANRRDDPFDALIIAKQDSRLTAATWAQLQPGRVATLWNPQFLGSDDENLAIDLVRAATKGAKSFDISMVQAISTTEDTKSAKTLLAAGFTHAADLIYLEWIPDESSGKAFRQLTFESYDERERERLAGLLRETYRGSLDCPVLDSIRTLDDTIEGYQATGDHDPKLWSIAREATQDVGVLLLTCYAGARQMELIYMGVVPSARGRGYGADLLRQAQHTAAERECKKLLLAVDSANTPALELYLDAGFQEWSRRSVFIFKFARGG